MGLASILDDLYDSEINIQISSFWDSGYTVRLVGDGISRFEEESHFLDGLDDVANEIIRMAVKHYPESDFGKKYSLEGS